MTVASRTLFEIAVDVTIMRADPRNPFEKLRAWEDSAKLKAAEQIARHFASQNKAPPDTFDPQLRYIKTDGPRIGALRLQFWKALFAGHGVGSFANLPASSVSGANPRVRTPE